MGLAGLHDGRHLPAVQPCLLLGDWPPRGDGLVRLLGAHPLQALFHLHLKPLLARG